MMRKVTGKYDVQQIKDMMSDWSTYWSRNNDTYRECNAFLNGNQWDNVTLSYYTESKKPALTINLLYLFLKQVIAEQIQNLPELEVVPKNMEVSMDLIKLLQDMVRTIFVYSSGEEALQTAAKQALIAFSAIRINTRYVDADTFQQEIYFEVLPDPTMIGFDPKAKNLCKDDGDFCYQRFYMSKEEWETTYPDIPFRSGTFGWGGAHYTYGNTFSRRDYVELCDFYVKEYYHKKLVKVSPTISGKQYDEIEEKDFEAYTHQYLQMIDQERQQADMMGQIYFTPELPKIIERRKARDYKIKCYRLRPDEILYIYDWVGHSLPMVYVDGDSFNIDGQQYVKSFTQEAHDLQKSINMIWSDIAQLIKTSRKERLIATPAMMAGFEDYYRNPERNYGVLPFNPDLMAPNGVPTLLAPPAVPPELNMHLQWAVQTLMNMLGRAESTMGVNPNGIQSQPTSGIAYEKMVMQQNMSSYIQFNNLFMAVQKIGESILDIIPKLYSDEQTVTLYDKDYQHKSVNINSYNPMNDEVENPISQVKATVILSPAPSFEMQKQVERDYIVSLLQAGATNPQVFSLVADQMAQLSETSITPEIVKRLKTIVPPEAIAASEGKPMPPPPPNPMVQIEQQKMQLAQQQLQLKQQEIQNDAAKNQVSAVSNLLSLQQEKLRANAEVQKAALETVKTTNQAHISAMKVAHEHQKMQQNWLSH